MKKSFGIFFDLDGTLVENEHLKALAFSNAIEQLGGKSHPSIYREVMGMSGLVV
jgi:beta-phosphoglucomutase-like phosphatase (HAD superfamily)